MRYGLGVTLVRFVLSLIIKPSKSLVRRREAPVPLLQPCLRPEILGRTSALDSRCARVAYVTMVKLVEDDRKSWNNDVMTVCDRPTLSKGTVVRW